MGRGRGEEGEGRAGPLTGGEKHDTGGKRPGEAGEGGLLSEGQDAHDEAGGGTQGRQDHEGPRGVPICCGSNRSHSRASPALSRETAI